MQEIQKESRVWQRVQQPPTGIGERDLRRLRRESMSFAGIYRQLAGSLRGSSRELAVRLYRQEMENDGMLRGLERLNSGDSGAMRPVPPPEEGTVRLLTHCYRGTCRAQGEYLARSVEPESGIVFRALAENAAAQCATIARLLGSLG